MVSPALLASLAAAALTVLADKSPADPIVPCAYIFEVEHGSDATALEEAAAELGTLRIRYGYEDLNGFSIRLHPAEDCEAVAASLAERHSIVRTYYPVHLHQRPDSSVEWTAVDPDMSHGAAKHKRSLANQTFTAFPPHVMTQVDKLRALGFTGKGVKIAVLDSGVDYTHPALGGCFGPGCHVAFGHDHVGDGYDGTNTPVPDEDPRDTCNGHGTHAAGIIAALPNEFGFSGIAPDATLGAYRIHGCHGPLETDILVDALHRARKDGANIISLSIGGLSGWSADPWSVSVQRIVERGVPCVVSAGNGGSYGLFAALSPSAAKGSTSVASFDTTETTSILVKANYTVDAGEGITAFGYSPGNPRAWDAVTLPLYIYPDAINATCGKLPQDAPNLADSVLLLHLDNHCDFDKQLEEAAAKGARYVLAFGDRPGAATLSLDTTNGILAAGMVTKETAIAWSEAVDRGDKVTLHMASPTLSDTYLRHDVNNATGRRVSVFSSWGPTLDMDMKPQVGGPGTRILSTYPLPLGGYAIKSGTSMSCPVVAGIIALVGQVRNNTFDPELINSLLSSTAKPQPFHDGDKDYDYYAPVAQQGGGLVQAYDAAFATTLVKPYALSFNDTDHFLQTPNVTISNMGPREVTYKLSNVPAITMYTMDQACIFAGKFPNEAVRAPATIAFGSDSITLRPNSSTSFEVPLTPPDGLDPKRLPLWSGWIRIDGDDGTNLSIPYQGLTGSLRGTTQLKPNGAWIARSNDTSHAALPANETLTMPRQDGKKNGTSGVILPAITANLTLGSSLLTAHLVPMSSLPTNLTREDHWGYKTVGQPFGFPKENNWLGPNSHDWNGKLASGEYAPAGKYFLVLGALRIFGDAAKRSDWDVAETPPFHIQYYHRRKQRRCGVDIGTGF
ncbi:hypothetical protein DCS_06133 [Drechmeria coniospora]|uniref:Subtilisin-like serine protease PR1C n=1 Tax=Drechmeria coniospora TaxID=98403 RepID=A0A151GAP9_DRECN|nr:hypothetical protein DCS_06133 [Drechmeria coniospora]KYK54176.1 hypothetical protein DCS_06133 [Drechmeria coniospora]